MGTGRRLWFLMKSFASQAIAKRIALLKNATPCLTVSTIRIGFYES
jgi:hypothetical protein